MATMGIRSFLHKLGLWPKRVDCASLAEEFVRGAGLELGPLVRPVRLPAGVDVVYVDKLSEAEQRRHYPELAKQRLTRVDVLDCAEQLAAFRDGSQDFVIASHLLEHCEDPVGALHTWLRVLVPGGVVLLALPDCRFSFDRGRPLTTVEHVLRDHREGPAWSRDEHYVEWSRFVGGKVDDDELTADVAHCRGLGYSIHFHVWTDESFAELLTHLQSHEDLPCDVVFWRGGGEELLAVLRRS